MVLRLGNGKYCTLRLFLYLLTSTGRMNRRQRQKQGIERAHTLGRYRRKQADQERHQKVLYYRQVKKLSFRETVDATGYSPSQICRIQALYRQPEAEDFG